MKPAEPLQPPDRAMFSAGWPGASAAGPAAGRRREPLSCGAVGVARQHSFCFSPSSVSFQFRFPLPSPSRGSRQARRRSDGQRAPVPAAAAMAQVSVVREVTQVLCAAGGALEVQELRRRLREPVGADALERLLRVHPHFMVASRAAEGGAAAARRVALAVSDLRLCRDHQGTKATCVGLCSQLHLCKFMVYGACHFARAG